MKVTSPLVKPMGIEPFKQLLFILICNVSINSALNMNFIIVKYDINFVK